MIKNKNINQAAPSEKIESRNKKLKRDAVFKIVAMLILSAIMLIFSSFAWFAMNKETGTGGMGIKAQGLPYVIRTRDSSGYYSDVYESLATGGAEWLVSSAYNFDNHEDSTEEGEEELGPGLEPGDSGILEFRVDPSASSSITVNCVFEMKAYLESIVRDDHGVPVLDEHGNPETEIREIENEAFLGYINAHIMLFSSYDETTGKYSGLIDNVSNDSLSRVLEDQVYTRGENVYTKIYWVWPERLENLASNDDSKILYDASERGTVINYIARNRNGFFKDCSGSTLQVSNDLTALSTEYSNAIYNHYSMRYDNADLEIGNNISYVMLTMKVEDQ